MAPHLNAVATNSGIYYGHQCFIYTSVTAKQGVMASSGQSQLPTSVRRTDRLAVPGACSLPSLAKSIPKAKKSHLTYTSDEPLESIYFKQVTNDEICKIILSLKNSVTGWDDISA